MISKLFFISSLLLLVGCTTSGVYECQVIQLNTGVNCNTLIGQRVHTCNLPEKNYDPRNGVPDYCLKNCLSESGYLSDYPPECVLIRVGWTKEQSNETNPLERTLTAFEGVYADKI